MTVYWREIKTPAHPGHCWDSSEVKTWQFSHAESLLSLAPLGPGIQMTGALRVQTVKLLTVCDKYLSD